MRRWTVELFEKRAFRPLYQWRLKRQQDPARAKALSQEVQGLDTLWRVATYVEAAIDEALPGSLWEVPSPPEAVLTSRRATPSDAAHLAQSVLALCGKESLLLTVYDGRFQEKQVVCAVEEAGSWHHISLQGMFSMYDAVTEIADDLHPGWSLLVARDPKMRIVTWKNAPPGAGQKP